MSLFCSDGAHVLVGSFLSKLARLSGNGEELCYDVKTSLALMATEQCTCSVFIFLLGMPTNSKCLSKLIEKVPLKWRGKEVVPTAVNWPLAFLTFFLIVRD